MDNRLGKKPPPENSDGSKKFAAQTFATTCTAAGHPTGSLASLAQGFLTQNTAEKTTSTHIVASSWQIFLFMTSIITWLGRSVKWKNGEQCNYYFLSPSIRVDLHFQMSTPNKPTAVPQQEGTAARCQAHPAHWKPRHKAGWGPGSHRWLVLLPLLAAQISYAPWETLQKPSALPSVQQTCFVTAQKAGEPRTA